MPEDPRLDRFLAVHGRIRSRFPQIDKNVRGHGAFCRHYKKDSVCRASFAHYNSFEEARAFLAGLDELLAE